MLLFYQPNLDPQSPTLPPDESRHCVRALRRQRGDTIRVVDGRGSYYEGIITRADPQRCAFDITRSEQEASRDYDVHLAIAPTKNLDRTEWLIEKAVEIGIDRLSFVRCAHSERRVLKTERLVKKAVAAMKQSGRATLPVMDELQAFGQWLSHLPAGQQRFIAYVDPQNPILLSHAATPKASYVVLVGPEGGFSQAEVAAAQAAYFAVVSLGPYRLRTETAGLMTCATLSLINQ